MKRDFLRLSDLSEREHRGLLSRALELKARRRAKQTDATLAGRTLLLIFEKPSTRTRVSFEAAIQQLGGGAITLQASESQLGRGETIADTARVTSSYVDAIVFRTFADERLAELAKAATVPVINGLSDGGHPVQVLADLLTVQERFKSLEGRQVAFLGDGASNMARSWAEATRVFRFDLAVAAPRGYRMAPDALVGLPRARLVDTAEDAVRGADVVATDVWTSMGQEAEGLERRRDLAAFQLHERLLAKANPKAIVLHCLPAHRGEEITQGVLEGPQSAVFDEAENRLHVQKALLELLMLG